MDVLTSEPSFNLAENNPDEPIMLSYSEETPYEEQKDSLASRIGKTKVYLWEDEVGKAKKRKRSASPDIDMGAQVDGDSNERGNAILLTGPPISTLPTNRLFVYAAQFDVIPLGLEWINDETCVLVFDGNSKATKAYAALAKSQGEIIDDEGFICAHSIPLTILPPEERIAQTLSSTSKARGAIKMRWALATDVKKRGAKRESEFYKRKRQRHEGEDLDRELDDFLHQRSSDEREDEDDAEPVLVSRMRSDYIASDGRTLLERTSVMRSIDLTVGDRVYSGRGSTRRPRAGGERDRRSTRRDTRGRRPREEERPERRNGERPKKTQQQLDDELDAFLRDGE